MGIWKAYQSSNMQQPETSLTTCNAFSMAEKSPPHSTARLLCLGAEQLSTSLRHWLICRRGAGDEISCLMHLQAMLQLPGGCSSVLQRARWISCSNTNYFFAETSQGATASCRKLDKMWTKVMILWETSKSPGSFPTCITAVASGSGCRTETSLAIPEKPLFSLFLSLFWTVPVLRQSCSS